MQIDPRGMEAAALGGPVNLMAAYRALVGEFGDDVGRAANFVWNAYKGLGRRLEAAETTWYPPGTDFDYPPNGEVFDPFEGATPHTPRMMASLQDAAETVAKNLVPVEEMRAIFARYLATFVSLGEQDREVQVNHVMEGIRRDLFKALPHQTGSAGHAFSDFKHWFLDKTKALGPHDTESAFQAFLEYVFKKAFEAEYSAMRSRISSGKSKWASGAREASVVRIYLKS